jgi:4-alpha-glucanotransferase
MKILQFAFGSGSDNPFLPHNHGTNFVVYTGTHDNNTSRGWYENDSTPSERDYFLKYLGQESSASRALVRAAMRSVAVLAITPLQDILDLGKDARMNFPGQVWDNWQWRLLPDQIQPKHLEELRELTRIYGRSAGQRRS